MCGALSDGSYRKHLETVRRRLSKARREVGSTLAGLGIEPWTTPRGGFSLWCHLPGGKDAAVVARSALSEEVVLAPGNVFSVMRSASHLMRFNVAQMDRHGFEVLERALDRSPVNGRAVARASGVSA